MELEEELPEENNENNKKQIKKNKTGRKPLVSGLSSDTFFSLSHILHIYAELILYLLEKRIQICTTRKYK